MTPRGDDPDTLARGSGTAVLPGTLGGAAADFSVTELNTKPPPGSGWLWLECTRSGWTTAALAAAWAAAAGIPDHDVTYAGRKDRHAHVRQWFALRGVAAVPPPPTGVTLHAVTPGGGPARLGGHGGNAFVLRLYNAPSQATLAAALARIADVGVPNYFGPQRFGRNGDNALRGARYLSGAPASRNRRMATLWLSAWQAARFNEVVDAWLRAGQPLHAADLIWHETAAQALPRGDRDGAPTGPLFGAKQDWPRQEPGERERAVLAAAGWPNRHAFEQRAAALRLWGARRPLWVLPRDVSYERSDDGVLTLRFVLPPGAYATAVVRELTGTWHRTSGPTADPG